MKRNHNPFLPLVLFILAITFNACSNTRSAEQVLESLEFAEIPAGSFVMGADLDPKYITAGPEEGWRSIFIQDEFPAREVTISKSFAISKYEITNAQYEAFDPDHRRWRGNFVDLSTKDNEAVVYVSWEDVVLYTRWLSEADTQYDYRLPTEAEWEYVARAGTSAPYSDGMNGDIYELNPMNEQEMETMNYQWPYPFTWSNGCRSWVKWLPENCTGVEDVYPNKYDIRDADLTVGTGDPNGLGVYDIMGNVEEWVLDWYGLYDPDETVDPVGPSMGDFKVSRGGSHNNHIQHMRSANRMSSAVNDMHYMLGFRVVRVPKGRQLPGPSLEQAIYPWAENVTQGHYQWNASSAEPVFSIHSLYELVPQKEDGSHYGSDAQMQQFGFDPDREVPILTGPLYTHNHSPTITWCKNGDLLVSWFSGESEIGPELTLLACRGVRQPDGSLEWTPPAEFLKAADRNMHSSNLLNNSVSVESGSGEAFTLHQMASIGVAGRWDKLALGYRKSSDNGATWSPIEMVLELDHALNDGASMQGNMFERSNGDLVFVTDDESDSVFNTGSLVVSEDGGNTWTRRGHSSTTPGEQRIAGLHAAVLEIDDRNGDGEPDLLAIARDKGKYFDGKAPQSISYDGGDTWERSPTVFPSISSGRRFSMIRLRYTPEQEEYPGVVPILFVGFADEGFPARNGEGAIEEIKGMYAAVSFDEGKTWKVEHRRVLSDLQGDSTMELHTAPWQRTDVISRNTGQDGGYMIATQTPDGMIYLTDGKLVYQFTLPWVIGK
jgi:formylglycine-generating enzyme required for sulfatase activity